MVRASSAAETLATLQGLAPFFRRIVDRQKGDIGVGSRSGRTVFPVRLPLSGVDEPLSSQPSRAG